MTKLSHKIKRMFSYVLTVAVLLSMTGFDAFSQSAFAAKKGVVEETEAVIDSNTDDSDDDNSDYNSLDDASNENSDDSDDSDDLESTDGSENSDNSEDISYSAEEEEEAESIFESDTQILEGISIQGIDVGGLTATEAVDKVNSEYMSEYTEKNVTLNVEGTSGSTVVTVGDMGYGWNDEETVDKAFSIGNRGNIIQRYKDTKDLENGGVNYDIEIQVDDDKMVETINDKCGEYNEPHVNAALKRVNGSFEISQEQEGKIIDTDTCVPEIHKYLLEEWDKKSDFSETLPMKVDEPTATVEDCEKVTDVIGTFSTTFSTGSSNYNRNKNMENGVRLLDGITLAVGETLSVNSHLEPWTEDNGWYAAGTYVNGKVEDSLGGGICQVSTTLYNAILEAEVEVVERYPHSMSVGYVPLSQDAALAGTYKDLKIKNNTETPLYIEGIYYNGKITFNIYGKETRPANRTIEYVSETLGTIPSTESVTQDPAKPAGYREVTSTGHTGYKARLIKRVYVDGELESEEVVNTSTYAASPTMVIEGTGEAVTETTTPAQESTTTAKQTTTQQTTTAKAENKNSSTNTSTENSGEAGSTDNGQEQQTTEAAENNGSGNTGGDASGGAGTGASGGAAGE